MFVKPASGRSVRDPKTKRHLPPEGAEVPESIFWVRRLAEGDVVRVDHTPDFSARSEEEQAP